MTPKNRKIVLIEWDDHCSSSSWRTPKTVLNEPSRNASVGWIMREDAKHVTIVQSFADPGGDDELVDGTLTIIKKTITCRKTLA